MYVAYCDVAYKSRGVIRQVPKSSSCSSLMDLFGSCSMHLVNMLR